MSDLTVLKPVNGLTVTVAQKVFLFYQVFEFVSGIFIRLLENLLRIPIELEVFVLLLIILKWHEFFIPF